jgi:hypothetical protein
MVAAGAVDWVGPLWSQLSRAWTLEVLGDAFGLAGRAH